MDPAELQLAIQRIKAVIAAASAETQGSTWEFDTWPPLKQRSGPTAIVEATQDFYLKLNLGNGQLLDRIQSPSPPVISPAGIYPILVAPILDMLEAHTEIIHKWLEGADHPDVLSTEVTAFGHWEERLAYYRAQVTAAGDGMTPSPEVWANVTMPLFAGLYPTDQGFAEMGISNPAVRSPPDVVYTSTVFWMVEITKAHRAPEFELLWADLQERTMLVIEKIVQTATEVVVKGVEIAAEAVGAGIKGLGKGLGISPVLIVGVAAAAGGAYYFTNRKKD